MESGVAVPTKRQDTESFMGVDEDADPNGTVSAVKCDDIDVRDLRDREEAKRT